MTYEQTRKQFLLALASNAYLNICECSDMINALKAIGKQIPIKPTLYKVKVEKIKIGNANWRKGEIVYKCPCCDTFINSTYDYCYKCGQALDWTKNRQRIKQF